MPTYQHAGLYVVETASPKGRIARQLRQLDPRLFLERQIGLDNKPVWCIVVEMPPGEPPITLLEHRDDSGEPIWDLTDGLVNRVLRMDRDADRLRRRVREANERLREEKAQQARDETAAIAYDMIPRITRPRSVVLPRGVYLRQSRDKRRAKGEIV